MQIYPHWLDGEFVRISTNSIGGKGTIEELICALKVHALLGTQFVLNDVQVFDSEPILQLFADEDFREFVKSDRDFLDLRVAPDPALGDRPFALAARGLSRTQSSGWSSSVFVEDATPIRALGLEIIDEIQRTGFITASETTKVTATYPRYEKKFRAIRHAVSYFGMHDTPKLLVAPKGDTTSYYRVLTQSLVAADCGIDEIGAYTDISDFDRQELLARAQRNLASLADTIDFIDKNIEIPDKRNARSQLLAVLNREQDLKKREEIWNNAVQAWNYATELTLQPDGGSIGNLPYAVSPSMYLAAPVDSLVPLGITENSGFHKARSFASLPLNLNELSWKAIAQARRETAESMTKLAESRATNFGGDVEAFAESLRIHIKNLANSLEPTKSVSKTPYVLTLGGAACGLTPLVGAAIGNVEATSVAMLTALASAAGTMAFSLKSNQYRDSDVQRRRGSLITTLHRAATGKST